MFESVTSVESISFLHFGKHKKMPQIGCLVQPRTDVEVLFFFLLRRALAVHCCCPGEGNDGRWGRGRALKKGSWVGVGGVVEVRGRSHLEPKISPKCKEWPNLQSSQNETFEGRKGARLTSLFFLHFISF